MSLVLESRLWHLAFMFMSRIYFRTSLLSLFVLAGILIFPVSCAKNGNTNWVWYDQTHCSDKWGPYKNNEDLKTVITAYFDEKGVKVHDIEIFLNGVADSCLACPCKTGKRIKLKVKSRDLKAIKEEGFYE